MTEKICPKCRQKSEEFSLCTHCGLYFDEYEAAKQEKLIEVRVLMSENKFIEARELAEKLPDEFPDNKAEFLLLLSNIKRDISIVEKFELALREYEAGDYVQVSFLLRNIKAFDSNLNEKVIGLRRKAERFIANSERFRNAVKEFEKGNYSHACSLFKGVDKSTHREQVEGYLRRIDEMKNDILESAVASLKENKIEIAGEQFQLIMSIFPEMLPDIDGYVKLLSHRLHIKNSLFAAARKAEQEKRLIEAKVLYSYVGLQFPDLMSKIRPHLEQIGSRAVISLADLQTSGLVDLEALGLEIDNANPLGFTSYSPGADEGFVADIVTSDTDEAGRENLTRVQPDSGCAADFPCPPLIINKEGVADFVL